MPVTNTRKGVIEDSYANDTEITVRACGLQVSGVVMDINPDDSFVLKCTSWDDLDRTFYPDEVLLK